MKTFIKLLLLTMSTSAIAAQVTPPNTFVAGQSAVAAEVNDNFTTLSGAINDNDTRITNIAGTTNGFDTKINSNANNVANNSKFIAANASVGTNNSNSINNNATAIVDNGQRINQNVTNAALNKANIDSVVVNNSSIKSIVDSNTNTISSNALNIDTNTSNVNINTMAIDINAASIETNTADIQTLKTANTTPAMLRAYDGNGTEIGAIIGVDSKNGDITLLNSKGYIIDYVDMNNGRVAGHWGTVYYSYTDCGGGKAVPNIMGNVLFTDTDSTGKRISYITNGRTSKMIVKSTSNYGRCTNESNPTNATMLVRFLRPTPVALSYKMPITMRIK